MPFYCLNTTINYVLINIILRPQYNNKLFIDKYHSKASIQQYIIIGINTFFPEFIDV